jgi:DNA-binding response OmpR family regulator
LDYVTKPFDMNEFIARLRALHRRAGANASANSNGAALHLTPTEWPSSMYCCHTPTG